MPVMPGRYNVEYFTGAQMSLYVGDILVDEVTSLQFDVMNSKKPIYGYASTLYDKLADGQVIIQGTFTINFKEAGYLYLVQDTYRQRNGGESIMSPFVAGRGGETIARRNVERIVNGEQSVIYMNARLQELGSKYSQDRNRKKRMSRSVVRVGGTTLGGYASDARHDATRQNHKNLGRAEGIFEAFENKIWKKRRNSDGSLSQVSLSELDHYERRADDPRLNPFDIFLTYGDFAGSGDDYDNHTMRRLRDVSIMGMSHQVEISDLPLQERYTFIARNII